MNEAISFTVQSPPKPKGRPRMTRRGRAYTPQATHDAERIIADEFASQWGLWTPDMPMFDGPVAVTIDYTAADQHITIAPVGWNSKMRSDVDNLGKLSLDALQLAGAFANDKQVVDLWLAKY